MFGKRLRSLPLSTATLAALMAATASLLIFAGTLASDLSWQSFGGDGGELVTASMTLGIPHPPGYPLYILLGRLFAFLPIGSIAARYSLFSAVAGSFAVGFVVLNLSKRNRLAPGSPLGLVAAGIALALTPLVWSQAIIAEVYALNLALLAFFLWTIVQRKSFWLIGLAFGLCITGHLSALMLLPLALWRVGRSGLMRFTIPSGPCWA
jgi:hypothetical protein